MSYDADSASTTPTQEAATVALLREGERGPEVLLLERTRKARFMPKFYVFPGGRVDPEDAELARSRGVVEAVRGVPGSVSAEREAAALVAAVRECFEEAGIWLAGPWGVPNPGPQARTALNAGDVDFPALLTDHQGAILSERLPLFAHWITPRKEPIRFDALTFACAVPTWVEGSHDANELVAQRWLGPTEALAAHAAGDLALSPPTWMVLRDMSPHESVEAIIDWARAEQPAPLLPEFVQDEQGVLLRIDRLRGSGAEPIAWLRLTEGGWAIAEPR